MSETSRRRCALLVALIAAAICLAGIAATAFLHRNPDVWADKARAPYFRVQSRSMEPAMHGPRFLWTCPNCKTTFPTSVDVGPGPVASELSEADAVSGATRHASGSNADSYDAKQALAKARYFTCPNCGFDRIPADSPTFEDGSLFGSCDDSRANATPSLATRFKRALKRETDKEYREKELKKSTPTVERWSVVVFKDKLGRPTLKRVLGLPNELVVIHNGDVLIDGKAPFRTWREIAKTAVPVKPVEFQRADDRVDVVHYTPVWENGETTKRPTAISNESNVHCCNGSNVAKAELVRDCALSFNWGAENGTPIRFAVLIRRPEKAYLLRFDDTLDQVTIRSKTLYNGCAPSGKPFETLTEADFANEEGSMFSFPTPLPEDPLFTVAAIDGSLIFAVDGEERVRYDLGDVDSSATAAIAQPFSLLGNVVHARNMALYRDLHYSNVTESRSGGSPDLVYETLSGRATRTSSTGYFMLGDNSPASIDSRFETLGVVDESDVMFVVE